MCRNYFFLFTNWVDQLIRPTVLFIFLIIYLFGYFNFNFLLNDEIIFDFVIFVLILYLSKLLSNLNYTSTRQAEDYLIRIARYILYYLVSFRSFLVRRKKDQDCKFIQFISYLEKESTNIFNYYIDRVNFNMINHIKRNLSFRLQIIVSLKRVELMKLFEISYRNKLFILC